MRKTLALSICLLFLPAVVIASTGLPNYKKEAKVADNKNCDGGKTKVTLYVHSSYDLEVVSTASGKTFFYIASSVERYFMKTGANVPVEMSHASWDAELKSASLNYFNDLHDLKSDCRPAN